MVWIRFGKLLNCFSCIELYLIVFICIMRLSFLVVELVMMFFCEMFIILNLVVIGVLLI